MRLTLGAQTFDLATRALVVGVVRAPAAGDEDVDHSQLCRRAVEAMEAGADVIELAGTGGAAGVGAGAAGVAAAVRAVTEAAGGAAAVAVSLRGEPSAGTMAAAYRAGAVMGAASHVSDPFLEVAATAGAAVVVTGPGPGVGGVRAALVALVEGARRAEAAGIPPDRIVVEPPLTPDLLPHVRRFAELGYPLLLTVTRADSGDNAWARAVATISLAVIDGCRLVRTEDVKAARRVCDVMAAVLAAR